MVARPPESGRRPARCRAAVPHADRGLRSPDSVVDSLCDLPVHGPGAAAAPVQSEGPPAPRRRRAGVLSWQRSLALVDNALSVPGGLYGGYFGAGIGILMLAALSIMGHTDIHQMNGVKNVLAVCINGVAAVYFA